MWMMMMMMMMMMLVAVTGERRQRGGAMRPASWRSCRTSVWTVCRPYDTSDGSADDRQLRRLT